MITLEDARDRLAEDGKRDQIEDSKELLHFDKTTVGLLLQVRSQIM